MIVQELMDAKEILPVMTLAPDLEQLLHNVLTNGAPGQSVVIEPGLAESLFSAAARSRAPSKTKVIRPYSWSRPSIRPWLSKMVRHRIPEMTVLSYTEIPDDQQSKLFTR
jgi:flagellar biosynthesis protein FlhA